MKIQTHTLNFINCFSENRAVCETVWENMVQRDRPQMTIWRMRFECGYLRLQTQTYNTQHLLLLEGNSSSFTWWIRYELYIGPRVSVTLSLLRAIFSYFKLPLNAFNKTRSSQNSLNVDSRAARSPASWQDNRTNCAKEWVSTVQWKQVTNKAHQWTR